MKLCTHLALAMLIVMSLGCSDDALEDFPTAPTPTDDWMRVATIGGHSVDRDDDDVEIARVLNDLVEMGCNVVEADSAMSEYMSDAEYDSELALMRRYSTLAHERNLKVVWYYPSLEVISVRGETGKSMYKDHPDWVQYSIDGTPNVFYGSKVFWVDNGDESAWMSPRSAYKDVFIHRVKQMAQTGVDGLWLDVPLYNDIVGRWASHHEADRAKFIADTGFEPPTALNEFGHIDPYDPVVRRWIAWRHEEIDAFLKDVLAGAREVNPEFNLIVETVTMDYNAAIFEGLDGAFQGPMDGLWHVWEVDVVSDTTSMMNAQPDDFYSLIAMYKFGRGADHGRAAWAFTYGYQPDDAEAVMGISLSAQVNPYELKSPEMTSTVGRDYRRTMFNWVRKYEDEIFRSESLARVLLLHSSASRDYVDICAYTFDCGVGLHATWNRPRNDIAWWTDGASDSVNATDYMAEYRGMVKALTARHIPFDLMPSRLVTAEMLEGYQAVVAPRLDALSDLEAQQLVDFVAAGGRVYFAGGNPGTLTEYGLLRTESALAELAPATPPTGGCVTTVVGQGAATYCNDTEGKRFLAGGDALARFDEFFETNSTALLETDAPGTVYAEVYGFGSRRIVPLTNFTGADGEFKAVETTFELRLDVGAAEVDAAYYTTPRGSEQTLNFSRDGRFVVMNVTARTHGMVIVDLK